MCVVAFCAVAAARSSSVFAQEHPHEAVHDQTIKGWTLTSDAQVFFCYNYQHRKFTDFSAWESQNWFMLTASRTDRRSRSTCSCAGDPPEARRPHMSIETGRPGPAAAARA